MRGFGDRGDLASAGEAHAVREVGLDVGDGAGLGDLREFARREQPLAGGERAVDATCDIGHRRGIAGLDHLLAEQRLMGSMALM